MFNKYLIQSIENSLENIMDNNSELYAAANHMLHSKGKRLRPYLSILTYKLKKEDISEIILPAISVELIHNYTLIHDDIMDDDYERRGKPTVFAKYGLPHAILAGDLLYAKAFETICTIDDSKKLSAVLKILSKSCIDVCEGQANDMEFENRFPTKDEYFDMISKKTGALITAPMEIGAILADFNILEQDAIYMYAREIGMTFQIQDDVLDLIGNQKTIGKPVGSDIRSGKKTLIVLHALETLPELEKNRLLEILGKTDANDEEISEAIILLSESISYVKSLLIKMTENAKQYLCIFDKEKINELCIIADYIIERIK